MHSSIQSAFLIILALFINLGAADDKYKILGFKGKKVTGKGEVPSQGEILRYLIYDDYWWVMAGDEVIGNQKDGFTAGVPDKSDRRRLSPVITPAYAGATVWAFSTDGIVIPYYFDSSIQGQIDASTAFGNAFRAAWDGAEQEFARKTRIRLVQRTTENNYITITKGGGCWSAIGDVPGVSQLVSIGDGCQLTGTIVHEILHALGFHHEQAREDRDRYLTVNYDQIITEPDDMTPNFDKMTGSFWSDCGGYDYGSIMQYPGWGFKKGNINTLVAKEANGKSAAENEQAMNIWPRPGLSDADAKCVDYVYSEQQCQTIVSTLAGDAYAWGLSSGYGKNWLISDDRWVSEFNECSRTRTINIQYISGCSSENKLIRVSGFAEGSWPNYNDRYKLDAQFKDANGAVISVKSTGWVTQNGASGIFKYDVDYMNDGGKATSVTITEYGDDAEYWGGHWGTILYSPKIAILDQCAFSPPIEISAWSIDTISDNGWVVNNVLGHWTGSYNLNTRSIVVDVSDKFGGCIGDTISVTGIAIGTWPGYGDTYRLSVEFRNAQGQSISTQDTGLKTLTSAWQKFTFSVSSADVASIYIYESANDAEYWAGHYGGKLALPVITDTQGSVSAQTVPVNKITSIKTNNYPYTPLDINKKHFHLPDTSYNGGILHSVTRNVSNNDVNFIIFGVIIGVVIGLAICSICMFGYVKRTFNKVAYHSVKNYSSAQDE